LLTLLGLDPNSLTFEAIYPRLGALMLASINLANMLALFGAIFVVATVLMRTIVPLRVFAIISNVFFISYAILSDSIATFFIYVLLLPINIVRLRQMFKLVKKVRASMKDDLSMDWLKPFMTRRKYSKNDLLFRKGEPANEMFFVATGKFLAKEIGAELTAGHMLGELGFLSPGNRRTQTVICTETGEVLTITYEKLLELYFQNPQFAYYFLRLSSERLLRNVARLEEIIEQNRLKSTAETARTKD
jgi:CRP-like cAMP-binding protein